MRLILCFLLFTLMLNGQKIVLEKTYGGALKEQLIDVEPTSDGGFGLLGVTFSYGNGGNDYYLVRINSSGDTLWTKTFGAFVSLQYSDRCTSKWFCAWRWIRGGSWLRFSFGNTVSTLWIS